MKILLHGAIKGSNFGDCLFADIFYNELKKEFPNAKIDFYENHPFGIGAFLKNKLNYSVHKHQRVKDYDALVYISGGLFGENSKSLLSSIKRFFRYCIPGLVMIKNKKKIYTVGVEVGPIHYGFLRLVINKIQKYSSLLIVRNKESLNYCKKNKITNAVLSYDTAFAIDKFQKQLVKKEKNNDCKIILLHMLPNDKLDNGIKNKILLPIIDFVHSHSNYRVIVSADELTNNDYSDIIDFVVKNNVECCLSKYNDYWKLCEIINQSQIVITRKLHVGIIAAAYNDSVISTPIHSYKTKRLYTCINEKDRCIPYNSITRKKMSDLLSLYCDRPIILDPEISKKSYDNLQCLCLELKKEDKYG